MESRLVKFIKYILGKKEDKVRAPVKKTYKNYVPFLEPLYTMGFPYKEKDWNLDEQKEKIFADLNEILHVYKYELIEKKVFNDKIFAPLKRIIDGFKDNKDVNSIESGEKFYLKPEYSCAFKDKNTSIQVKKIIGKNSKDVVLTVIREDKSLNPNLTF